MSASKTSFVAALAVLLAFRPAIAQGEINASQLGGVVEVAAVGALDHTEANLPSSLWSGSDRAVVAQLVAELPARIASPALADLTRRALAVSAKPPAGEPLVPNFAHVRAEGLLRIGQTGLAARLIAGLPKAGRDESSELLLINASLLNRDVAGACEVARGRVGRAESAEFAKVNAFCDVLSGDISRAHFSAAVVAELAPDDSAYFELLGVLFHEGTKTGPAIANLVNPSPLHRTMLSTASLSPDILPAGGLPDPNAPDAVAVEMLLATDPTTASGLRQEAGRYAIQANAMDFEGARQLFMMVGESDTPFNLANIIRMPPGPERVVAIERLLTLGRDSGAAATTAKLILPILTNLSVVETAPEVAREISRSLILAAELDAAGLWLDQLQSNASVPNALDEAVKLEQVMAIASGRDLKPFTGEEALRWIRASGTDNIAEKAFLLRKLRQSVGLEGSPVLEAVGLVKEVSHVLPSNDIIPLQTSAAENRVGETILRAVKLVSAGDIADQHLRLAAASRALFDIGLAEEAKQIAAESAVMGGL